MILMNNARSPFCYQPLLSRATIHCTPINCPDYLPHALDTSTDINSLPHTPDSTVPVAYADQTAHALVLPHALDTSIPLAHVSKTVNA